MVGLDRSDTVAREFPQITKVVIIPTVIVEFVYSVITPNIGVNLVRVMIVHKWPPTSTHIEHIQTQFNKARRSAQAMHRAELPLDECWSREVGNGRSTSCRAADFPPHLMIALYRGFGIFG